MSLLGVVLWLGGFAAGSIALLWITQTILVRLQGAPPAAHLRLRQAPSSVRHTMRVVVPIVLIGMLIGYPMALGESPIRYHAARLIPARLERMFELLVAATLVLLVGIGAEVALGWVRLTRRDSRWTTLRKVVEGLVRPVPLAFLEEGLFRGIVLDQIFRALPAGRAAAWWAIACSAAAFSGVHFIRQVKTYWTAIGLFLFGCLTGAAYLAAGRTYWLPVGLHAGGILAIQLHRPFVEYRGPAWIIGTRDYPIAGLVGMSAILLLGVYVAIRFPAG